MSRSSKVVRDLLLLIGLPFMLMVGLLIRSSRQVTGQAPRSGNLFVTMAGRWSMDPATTSCDSAWQEVTFDSARTRMDIVSAAGRRDAYLIQEREPDRLITLLVGDSTLGDDGAQAVWILIVTTDTSFVWRRRDWFAGHVSEPAYRCPARPVPSTIIPG